MDTGDMARNDTVEIRIEVGTENLMEGALTTDDTAVGTTSDTGRTTEQRGNPMVVDTPTSDTGTTSILITKKSLPQAEGIYASRRGVILLSER